MGIFGDIIRSKYNGVNGSVKSTFKMGDIIRSKKRYNENQLINNAKHDTSGYVYLFQSIEIYKIGMAINVSKRLKSLKTGNLRIKHIISKKFDNVRAKEKELHKKYNKYRIPKTEWFNLPIEIVEEIKRELT